MFDTYTRFLGIDSTERPLTDWQLLGVTPAEKDAAVLEEAALQRFDQIRPYVLKYPQEATSLLNEIAQALNNLQGSIPKEEVKTVTRVKHTTVVHPTALPVPEADEPVPPPEAIPLPDVGEPSFSSTPAEVRVKTMARHAERPGKMTMLVVCQGDIDGEGNDVSVWQIKMKKMSITDRQRQKLRGLLEGTPEDALRARILGRIGGAPAYAVRAMVKKGLATLKRMWNPQTPVGYSQWGW